MKRRVTTALLIVLTALLVATPVFAYIYRATYTITSANTTAYVMLGVSTDNAVNNQWMADNGYFNSSANDTRIETLSGLIRPHMVTDNATFTAVAVPANSQTNLYFTTGNSELDDFPIIPGYGGYVTVADEASIELGDNFTIEQSGWINTDNGSNKNVVYKEGALRIFVSDTISGNITAIVGEGSGSDTLNLIPNAAGDYTNIPTLFGAPTHWEAVDDPVATPDDMATYVKSDTTATQYKDAYNVTSPEWLGVTQTITSVKVYYRHFGDSVNSKVQPFLRLGASETAGTQINCTDGSWVTTNEALARPGGGSWVASDFNDLQVVVGVRGNGDVRFAWITQTYIQVAYTYVALDPISATGISSGEHTIKVTADGTDLKIFIDDVEKDSLALDGGSVPNTSANWTFVQSNVMPYSDNISFTINGIQELWFQPTTMIIGTTLPDRATSVANDGTFVWGSNPAGVSVALGGLVSGAQPAPGLVIEDPTPDILPGVEVTDWYIEPDVGGTLLTNPLRPFVTIVSDTTTLTELQAWRLLGTAVLLMIIVSTAKAVRGHHAITGIATGAAILGLVTLTIYPMWTLVFTALFVIGGLISERTPSL